MRGSLGTAGLMPDPHRLDRAHVVGVRMDRSGTFVVACSDGIDLTWDEWRAWGCADLRATALSAARRDARDEGGER